VGETAFDGLTVSAGLALSLLNFAASQGADRARLLHDAAIDPGRLDDLDARIAFAQYVGLMRAAKTRCNNPALALQFGAADDMAHHSVVGLLGQASATMMEALQQLNRYGQLVIEVDLCQPGRFRLDRRDDGVWLVDVRERPNLFPELTESTFARMTAGSRRGFGRQSALQVRVTHPRPAYADQCEAVFGAPVTYAAARNEIQIDPGWPDLTVAQQPRFVFGILARHADALLADLMSSHSLRGRIEAALIPVLHKGPPTIDMVARDMGMSRATLYRRLRGEGATYAGLLDALRQRLALDYLNAGKTSVNEVAYLTGFSDPAAFSRACKRWTGHSPRAMRAAAAQRMTTPNKSCSSASSMTTSTMSPARSVAATSRR
jgi:AraC-like DNA-binding protein